MDGATMAGGPSLWQVGGALVAVFALLIVVLKFLQRWQRSDGAGADARVLSVRRLGPRRELQVLRVGDEVHTLYRHEAAMVLLKTESLAGHQAAVATGTTPATPPLHRRLRALVGAAGGAAVTTEP